MTLHINSSFGLLHPCAGSIEDVFFIGKRLNRMSSVVKVFIVFSCSIILQTEKTSSDKMPNPITEQATNLFKSNLMSSSHTSVGWKELHEYFPCMTAQSLICERQRKKSRNLSGTFFYIRKTESSERCFCISTLCTFALNRKF